MNREKHQTPMLPPKWGRVYVAWALAGIVLYFIGQLAVSDNSFAMPDSGSGRIYRVVFGLRYGVSSGYVDFHHALIYWLFAVPLGTWIASSLAIYLWMKIVYRSKV